MVKIIESERWRAGKCLMLSKKGREEERRVIEIQMPSDSEEWFDQKNAD